MKRERRDILFLIMFSILVIVCVGLVGYYSGQTLNPGPAGDFWSWEGRNATLCLISS
jgi:hypothetical protein